MIHLPKHQREAITEACRRHGGARMYLFGSALRDDFRPGDSDVDLLVEFRPMTPHELADAYFEQLDSLRSILAGPVDLVMADAVQNPYIAAESSAPGRSSMPRDARAYLLDIVQACDAIAAALHGIDLDA